MCDAVVRLIPIADSGPDSRVQGTVDHLPVDLKRYLCLSYLLMSHDRSVVR